MAGRRRQGRAAADPRLARRRADLPPATVGRPDRPGQAGLPGGGHRRGDRGRHSRRAQGLAEEPGPDARRLSDGRAREEAGRRRRPARRLGGSADACAPD